MTNETVEGYRALLIPTDPADEIREVVIADRGDHGLADMYAQIGCDYVEHVPGRDCSLWVDEDGAVRKPAVPLNPRAVALTRTGALLRGVVLVTGLADDDGETQSLTAADVQRLRQLLAGGA